MRQLDETALICDFAEYYRIYDYRSLPARYVAKLATGLRADSRIMSKVLGAEQQPPYLYMVALAVDEIRNILWALAGDPKSQRPPTLVSQIYGEKDTKETKGFNSPEEFDRARKRIIERAKNNGN